MNKKIYQQPSTIALSIEPTVICASNKGVYVDPNPGVNDGD